MEEFIGRIAPAEAESPLRCSGCNRYLSNAEMDQYTLQEVAPECCTQSGTVDLVVDIRADASPSLMAIRLRRHHGSMPRTVRNG